MTPLKTREQTGPVKNFVSLQSTLFLFPKMERQRRFPKVSSNPKDYKKTIDDAAEAEDGNGDFFIYSYQDEDGKNIFIGTATDDGQIRHLDEARKLRATGQIHVRFSLSFL